MASATLVSALGMSLLLLACWMLMRRREVVFVGPGRTLRNMAERTPGYLDSMTGIDLAVRGVGSGSEFKGVYKSSLCRWSDHPSERGILRRASARARGAMRAIGGGAAAAAGRGRPWRIACASPDLEAGYPHTVGDTIVISPQAVASLSREGGNSLEEVLAHEAAHVRQRSDPEGSRGDAALLGAFPSSSGCAYVPARRANPDTGVDCYELTGAGSMGAYYAPGAESISDVVYGAAWESSPNPEHPNEIVADGLGRAVGALLASV